MSEINSSESSGNIKRADSNNINTTPDLNRQSDNANENTHGYFIPVVMMIVLGVIIVATFYSQEFNNLIAGSVSPDQADALISDTGGRSTAITGTLDVSADTAELVAITDTTSENNQADEMATSTIETAASASIPAAAETSTRATVADQTLSTDNSHRTSLHYPPYTGRHNRKAYDYAPPMAYAVPEHYQNTYINMLKHRHRSHQQARQVRREQMIKVYEYRTAVRERIKQNRLGRYQRMQEIEQDNRGRLDRIEQEEKRSMNRPV